MQHELFNAIRNTCILCGLSCLLALPIGACLAILLVRTDVRGRTFAWLAIGSQLTLPLYVFAGGWSAAMGTQGWARVFGPNLLPAPSSLSNLLAVAIVHGLAAIPWVCLILSLGLLWTDRGEEETARIEGGTAQLLRFVVLARLRIWFAASCLWCCFSILTEMVVSNLYQVTSVAEQIYLDASRGSLSPLTYLAAAFLCVLPILGTGIGWFYCAPPWQAVIARVARFKPHPIPLGRWRLATTLAVHALVLGLVAIPLASLLTKAGWRPYVDPSGATRFGWSWERLATTLVESTTLFRQEFYWSITLALASTIVAGAVVGLLLCVSSRRGYRTGLSLLMLFPLAIPGPLAGIIVIWCLNRSTPAWLGELYDHTLAAPILAQQFRLLPLAWLLALTVLASIESGTWEQWKLDGGGRWHAFRYVVFPQVGQHGFVAAMLLFVFSLGELSSSILVLPPGVTTISMRLFEMLHFGMRHQDSGLCILLMLIGGLFSAAWWKTLSER